MAQVGRISGPLLTANLERNGINLTFRNTTSDTQLLFLDVNSGKIGINKGVSGHELDVNGITRSTNLISDTITTIANYTVESNNLNVLVGNIYLDAPEAIKLSNFETDNIHISDNTISTYRSNAAIDLIPHGTGTLEVFSNLDVIGNIHATGSITADGNIVIGDSDTDNVTLNADLGNDIIPATTNTYALGSNEKRWDNLYTNLLNGSGVVASELIANGGGDFSLRQGNMFFVSINGSDLSGGDNVQGPFRTVKRALEAADASTQGPVTIQVFAGEYEEEFPLTVPSNVTVQGVDMRNTIIKPTVGTNTNDAFLLNGETTVQSLTIKDFYAPGYAFKFASGTIVSTRSPYIQNVSVITKGSVTSVSDPRGFDEADAGGGAYIDGASVNSASNEASMLFHSVTFITPGVDAVIMTNGVRVEWLNSFTYFANRGLYAIDGVTGHLSTDGSTVKYGAEIRSIGSANVYGTYGAVADGADTLMYLIQHNFGYIGVGKDTTNDPNLTTQANEVVKLNSGRIYYQSVDHFGNFRVGDQFFIDQESGNTSIVLTEAEVDSLNGLVITTNEQTTFIDGEKIDLGDFTISGNTIETSTQDFNVNSTGTINFISNVAVANNLTMTGDISIGGTLITLGNQSTDTVNFNTPFSQNIEPDISGVYNLGSANKKWIKSWLGAANFADIEFNENYITTTTSNADLELRASTSASETVLGPITRNHPNLFGQNDIEVSSVGYYAFGGFPNHQIRVELLNGAAIYFAVQNSSTTESIVVPNVTATFRYVYQYFSRQTFSIVTENGTGSINSDDFTTPYAQPGDTVLPGGFSPPVGNFVIPQNIRDLTAYQLLQVDNILITLDYTEIDLPQKIYIPNNDVQIDNNLTTNGVTTLSNTNITGTVTHTGNSTISNDLDIIGALHVTGLVDVGAKAQLENILIDGNLITTTASNSDLDLRASGTGNINITNNDVVISNAFTVRDIIGTDLVVQTSVALNEIITSSQIVIDDNFITTSLSNSDLELRANGTGGIQIQDDMLFNQNVISTTQDLNLTAGGNVNIISNSALLLSNGNDLQRVNNAAGNIRFSTQDNVFEGYGAAPIGFGGIYSSDRRTSVLAHPTNDTINIAVNNLAVSQVNSDGIVLHGLQTDDININGNVISTSVSNSNLELVRNGTGSIVIGDTIFKDNAIINNNSSTGLILSNTSNGYVKFAGTGAVLFPSGNNTTERGTSNQIGDSRWNETDGYMEVWDGVAWITAQGGGETVTQTYMEELIGEWSLILG